MTHIRVIFYEESKKQVVDRFEVSRAAKTDPKVSGITMKIPIFSQKKSEFCYGTGREFWNAVFSQKDIIFEEISLSPFKQNKNQAKVFNIEKVMLV